MTQIEIENKRLRGKLKEAGIDPDKMTKDEEIDELKERVKELKLRGATCVPPRWYPYQWYKYTHNPYPITCDSTSSVIYVTTVTY